MKKIEPGINWTWYMCDTEEEATEWYKEMFNQEPPAYEVCKMNDGRYGFRVHK